jgi:ABC-2 type transport system ATP-binding protein
VIKNLKTQGKTVFFSTHITSDVESICDRVAILNKGELQSVDEVGEILLQGVVGYELQIRQVDGNVKESFVNKAELSEALEMAQQDQSEVILVEPRRKTLEQFFLDKIDAG